MTDSDKGFSTPILAVTACVLWSTAFAGIKIGLNYTGPLSLAGMRFFTAGILTIPLWGGLRAGFGQIRRSFGFILVLSLFQTVLLYSAFFIAMTMISGALGAILMGASPVITALISHFTLSHDKMTMKSSGALAVGMAGIVVISLSREPWTPAGLRELYGILLIMFSNLCSAFANVLIKKKQGRVKGVVLSSSQMIIGGLVLFLISLVMEKPVRISMEITLFFSVLWLAAISAAGFGIWFSLLQRPGVLVSSLNVWMFIVPVFGAVFSWLILPDESPNLFSLAGMVCVALSLYMYNRVKS